MFLEVKMKELTSIFTFLGVFYENMGDGVRPASWKFGDFVTFCGHLSE